MSSQNKSSHVQYSLLAGDEHGVPIGSSVTLEDSKFDRNTVFAIPFGRFAVATVSLPLIAFAFCVLWSLWFNFVQTTATHCNVPNYLPSMSAAIGAYGPQRYVWRFAIALHSSPRYLVAYIYYTKHKSKLVLTLNWLELSGLLGLTFVSSTENYRKQLHTHSLRIFVCAITILISALSAQFVVLFLVASLSLTHMQRSMPNALSRLWQPVSFAFTANYTRFVNHSHVFISLLATSDYQALTYMFLVSYASQYNLYRKTLRAKRYLAWINLASGCLAVYFFSRHNQYCEAGMYTLFAIAEYIIVSSNIFFHFQAYHDLSNVKFCIQSRLDDNIVPYAHGARNA